MTPSPAEIVRTLARGRLPGTLQIADLPPSGPARPVRYATGAAGRPLVLARDGDPLTRAWPDPYDAPVLLTVEDVPPVDGAPSVGRAHIAGRLRRLAPAAQAAAVQEFAEANPVTDLLDVGRSGSLYTVEVDRVRLRQRSTVHEVDLTAYARAEPDPLHELEADLLTDLADHHAPQVESFFRFLLALAGIPCCRNSPRAVRLDRYGFLVDLGAGAGAGDGDVDGDVDGDGVGAGAGTGTGSATGAGAGAAPPGRWVRLNFQRPVHCRHELAHLLHPVLFPHHAGRRAH